MSAIPDLDPSVVSQEFYEPQRLQVYALVAEATGMVTDVSALVADYAIHLDLFGSPEWKRYFNQDVGEEPSLPDAFWKFWRSPDPVNLGQKVWETHLPPVLRPKFVIDMDTKARRDFCLTVMGELMQK